MIDYTHVCLEFITDTDVRKKKEKKAVLGTHFLNFMVDIYYTTFTRLLQSVAAWMEFLIGSLSVDVKVLINTTFPASGISEVTQS